MAKVEVDTPYFSGPLKCCVIEEPIADLILGNISGVSPIAGLLMGDCPSVAAAVETRAQRKAAEKEKPALNIPVSDLSVSTPELISLQEEDPSLHKCRDMFDSGECAVVGKGSCSFFKEGGVLFRAFAEGDSHVSQVVVPVELRSKVLFAAHDGLLAGHCGVNRTLKRALNRFWWPGIRRDVRMYCRTCEVCQKCTAKGRTPCVPLAQMPRIEQPFQRVAVDIVGPFSPVSEEKHRYLLTVIDVATRFPEAVPLKTIDSVTIAELCLLFFADWDSQTKCCQITARSLRPICFRSFYGCYPSRVFIPLPIMRNQTAL